MRPIIEIDRREGPGAYQIGRMDVQPKIRREMHTEMPEKK
jgi:hypothetical protein